MFRIGAISDADKLRRRGVNPATPAAPPPRRVDDLRRRVGRVVVGGLRKLTIRSERAESGPLLNQPQPTGLRHLRSSIRRLDSGHRANGRIRAPFSLPCWTWCFRNRPLRSRPESGHGSIRPLAVISSIDPIDRFISHCRPSGASRLLRSGLSYREVQTFTTESTLFRVGLHRCGGESRTGGSGDGLSGTEHGEPATCPGLVSGFQTFHEYNNKIIILIYTV
jgi:hypothetical protein